jgi:hypothetical protein
MKTGTEIEILLSEYNRYRNAFTYLVLRNQEYYVLTFSSGHVIERVRESKIDAYHTLEARERSLECIANGNLGSLSIKMDNLILDSMYSKVVEPRASLEHINDIILMHKDMLNRMERYRDSVAKSIAKLNEETVTGRFNDLANY